MNSLTKSRIAAARHGCPALLPHSEVDIAVFCQSNR